MTAMNYFLDNRFAPTTFSLGFLDAPFDETTQVFTTWMGGVLGKCNIPFELVSLRARLTEVLEAMFPVTTPHTKQLLCETTSRWTAYCDNGLRGADPISRVGHMCTILKCRGVAVSCVPHIVSEGEISLYGGVQFQMFAPEQREFLNYERGVSAVVGDDDRWCFDASGPVQPFEETAQYSAPRIQDRFTPEMLERYCAALGIDLFNPEFYGPQSMMIVEKPRRRPGQRYWTREEARRQFGLE